MMGKNSKPADAVLLFILRAITFLLLIFFYFGSLFVGAIDSYAVIVGFTLLLSTVTPISFMKNILVKTFFIIIIGVSIVYNFYYTIRDINSGMPIFYGLFSIRSVIVAILLIYLFFFIKSKDKVVNSEFEVKN